MTFKSQIGHNTFYATYSLLEMEICSNITRNLAKCPVMIWRWSR